MWRRRSSGILLPVFSLPGEYGIGDFGAESFRWIDCLHENYQKYWQVLPLNASLSHSPYFVSSAFAGNPFLISPERIAEEGLLKKEETVQGSFEAHHKVSYEKVASCKNALLRVACGRMRSRQGLESDFLRFCENHRKWLDDFALYAALKRHFHNRPWHLWPEEIRDRKTTALRKAEKELKKEICFEQFIQYCFYRQWEGLKQYANEKGILIFGDLPFYVAADSADAWIHPEYFKLTASKRPRKISGVPPDAFSRTGQVWGTPVYHWKKLKEDGYSWWIDRIRHNLSLYDLLRIDHFRGFVACWEIPASEKTAEKGKWVKAPGDDFFGRMFQSIQEGALIAEDLGMITTDVSDLLQKYRFPTMKVLLFAFGGTAAENPHLPHNHVPNSVVYTGTHDNDTVRGWFKERATEEEKNNFYAYVGRKVPESQISQEMMRLAFSSVSSIAILPFCDILDMGNEARINNPGHAHGNWLWRFRWDDVTSKHWRQLRRLTVTYGRDSE